MAFDKLVFEEHFDGDTLNRDIWDYEIGFIRNHDGGSDAVGTFAEGDIDLRDHAG